MVARTRCIAASLRPLVLEMVVVAAALVVADAEVA